HHRPFGALDGTARVDGGYDRTFSQGTDFTIWSVDPSLHARYKASEQLTFAAGVEGNARSLTEGSDWSAAGSALATITSQLSTSEVVSGFAEALWRPTSDWLIRPGVRADDYHDTTATK